MKPTKKVQNRSLAHENVAGIVDCGWSPGAGSGIAGKGGSGGSGGSGGGGGGSNPSGRKS